MLINQRYSSQLHKHFSMYLQVYRLLAKLNTTDIVNSNGGDENKII
jgi:hypothetical protein